MSEPNIIRLERRNGPSQSSRSDVPTRFLSLRQVIDRTSISRSLVYQLIKDEERPFPAPIHIGRRSVWIEAEVEGYLQRVIEDVARSKTASEIFIQPNGTTAA